MEFCTNCGRPLMQGEVCNCQSRNDAANQNNQRQPQGYTPRNPEPQRRVLWQPQPTQDAFQEEKETLFCGFCGRPLRGNEPCPCRLGNADNNAQPAPQRPQPLHQEPRPQPRHQEPRPQPQRREQQYSQPGAEQSRICPKCGRRLRPGEVCNCTSPNPGAVIGDVKDRVNGRLSKNEMLNGTLYERGARIVPDNISENEGEVPIKQYDVAVMRTRSKFMRSECRMQVTNKRLLFRATGPSLRGKTTLQHEFAIDEIAGLEIHKNFRFSIIDLILMMMLLGVVNALTVGAMVLTARASFAVSLMLMLPILGVAGFMAVTRWKKHFVNTVLLSGAATTFFAFPSSITISALSHQNYDFLYNAAGFLRFITVVMIILGVTTAIVAFVQLYLFCYKPNLVIDIKTKGGMAPISIKRQGRGFFPALFTGEDSGFREVLPAKDTDLAIKEIGALLNDIQKLGDFGIEKWKTK